MVFGEVGLGADGAGRERSGASGGGVAIELALAAASAWTEHDVLLKGAAAVEEVELAVPDALGGFLTNDSQHDRGRIFAGSLFSGGECKVFIPAFIVDCFFILCCDFSCSF
jgi:hypothetical protein